MRDVLGSNTILGYCTNVHAGATWEQIVGNLRHIAARVKAIAVPAGSMGIGLWVPRSLLEGLLPGDSNAGLAQCLAECQLEPFTFNGFPYGDFHESAVKHRVYRPDWLDTERLVYTLGLAAAYEHVLRPQPYEERSISTLPVGWGRWHDERLEGAADRLADAASALAAFRDEQGVTVHVDCEPEPGCVLDTADDVVGFFSRFLASRMPDVPIRRHIRVCHDVCHSAVMFEDQAEALAKYRAAGIKVGKVQISSAVRVPFDEMNDAERREAFGQLKGFNEPRYLHQTMIRTDDGQLTFFEDLPLALQEVERGERELRGEWRVHFHVPVFLERFGLIQTTQADIAACLRAIRPEDEVHHFEVETYAWNVLPRELQVPDLAEGIAKELLWVKEQAAAGAFR